MHRWIRKLHMYAGLLTFSSLVVYGVAGLVATTHAGQERKFGPATRMEYTVPQNLTDKEVADRIRDHLGLRIHWPIPSFASFRDPQGALQLDYYSVNGRYRVQVKEAEHAILVQQIPNGMGRFTENLHATTVAALHPDWRVRWWSYYNEFSIWTLIGMSLSGLYLWLSTRIRHRWAGISFALGSGIFIVLYGVTR